MTPVVSIVGKSKSGKTTFLEKLIAELKRRGYAVATIKHSVHGFEIDRPGKDTWRHAEAGADAVMIASSDRLALMKKLDGELELARLVELLGPGYDVVLTEGFKLAASPKIEVSRRAVSEELICTDDELLALVSDVNREALNAPRFGLDDAPGVADLLERRVLGERRILGADGGRTHRRS